MPGEWAPVSCWDRDMLHSPAVMGSVCAGAEGHGGGCSRRLRLLVARSPAVLPGGECTKVEDKVRVSQIARAPGVGFPLALGILKVFSS